MCVCDRRRRWPTGGDLGSIQAPGRSIGFLLHKICCQIRKLEYQTEPSGRRPRSAARKDPKGVEMAYSWRTTVLADRHKALGSKLEDWIGMPTAWTYEGKTVADDYLAIRTKAGLMDVSGLKKI